MKEGFTDRFIVAEWHVAAGGSSGASPVTNSLFLTKPRDCELADAQISVSPGVSPELVRLETDAPAFFVQAECDIPGRFEDAGFTLLPGEGRELRFLPAAGTDVPMDLATRVMLRHLRGTY